MLQQASRKWVMSQFSGGLVGHEALHCLICVGNEIIGFVFTYYSTK